MDNTCITSEVGFFGAAPKDVMVRYFLMSLQKTRNPLLRSIGVRQAPYTMNKTDDENDRDNCV